MGLEICCLSSVCSCCSVTRRERMDRASVRHSPASAWGWTLAPPAAAQQHFRCCRQAQDCRHSSHNMTLKRWYSKRTHAPDVRRCNDKGGAAGYLNSHFSIGGRRARDSGAGSSQLLGQAGPRAREHRNTRHELSKASVSRFHTRGAVAHANKPCACP